MYLERLLQINMAMLSALGALLLGMGQRDALMPLGMLIAATASVILTDIKRCFRFNRAMAGAAAFAAVGVAFYHTRQLEGESLLLAIANLLVVLQAILLFQAKDDRIYAQLVVLCLLEAVVSTLFAQGVWYGILLGLEMLAGMIALTLMFLVRQIRPFHPSPAAKATAGQPSSRRWPLGQRKADFHTASAGSSRLAFGGELFRRLAMIGVATITISVLIFFAMPRFGESAWRGIGGAKKNLVGFSDSVTLGEMGEVLEDPSEVMQVRLIRKSDGKSQQAGGDIYLRGATLAHYERGRWGPLRKGTPEAPAANARKRYLANDLSPLADDEEAAMLQQIIIEPLDRAELFCIWRPVCAESNINIYFDPGSQKFFRTNRMCGQRFGYVFGTSAFRDGVQSPITPSGAREAAQAPQVLLQMPDLPETKALAAKWLSQSPPLDRIGRATRLAAMFRDSGLFQYSLQGQMRNVKLDPIEDFVSEHREGHCEYFSSALCMMLRSQGIPARIVAGFHTDEFNAAGKFYEVRQLHAHTWVEVFLAPEDLPAELCSGADRIRYASGGWLRLDATPGLGDGPQSLSAQVSEKFDWIRSLWDSYIVEMNRQRQIEAIYQPVLRMGREIWRRVSDAAWWRGLIDSLLGALGMAWLGGGRVAVWVMLAIAAAIVLLVPLWRLYRLLRRRRAGKRLGEREKSLDAIEVEFYARFESLLTRQGFTREPRQTPREFVLAAASMPQTAALGLARDMLVQVADCYYQVRFGRLPLDNPQRETVEQVIAVLEALSINKEKCNVC